MRSIINFMDWGQTLDEVKVIFVEGSSLEGLGYATKSNDNADNTSSSNFEFNGGVAARI